MSTKSRGVSCYDKAGENEPLFVLRAQDQLADLVVRYWADLAQRAGVRQELLSEARKVADEMQQWPARKIPD